MGQSLSCFEKDNDKEITEIKAQLLEISTAVDEIRDLINKYEPDYETV